MNGGAIVAGQAVISGGDAAEVLEPAEHTLDGIAAAIEPGREAVLPLAIGFRRDVGNASRRLDLAADGIAVIALVAVNHEASRQVIEQFRRNPTIRHIAAAQDQQQRTPGSIGQGMDFARSPATRAANRLAALPPFPPLAQRCALTAELSINTSAGGPPAAARA